MLCFNFQFLFTDLADPVVFSFDKGVVMDSLAVVIRAEVTFHDERFYFTHTPHGL